MNIRKIMRILLNVTNSRKKQLKFTIQGSRFITLFHYETYTIYTKKKKKEGDEEMAIGQKRPEMIIP